MTDLTAKKPQVIDGDKGTFVQFSFGAPDNKCVNAKGELVNYKLTVNLYCNSIESNGLSSPKVNYDDYVLLLLKETIPMHAPSFQ